MFISALVNVYIYQLNANGRDIYRLHYARAVLHSLNRRHIVNDAHIAILSKAHILHCVDPGL